MITLHGVTPSPFVRKVVLCLKLKGLDYEQVDVFPVNMPEEFKKLSPLLKIPALEDGDLKLSDSSVICEYLNDKYPSYDLFPQSAEDKAKARWYEEYADSVMIGLASGLFFERVLKPMIGGEADEARVDAIILKKLPEQYKYIETFIPEQGFLFGETLLLADIALATHFINAGYAGYEIDKTLAPKFYHYVERFKAEPLVKAQMASDQVFFDALAPKK